VSPPPEAPGPRAASGAPRVELVEILQEVRHDLAARGEDLSGDWVESSAAELASGAKPGWYLPAPAGGVAFYAARGGSAFGHLHTRAGPTVARGLAATLLAGLSPDVASLDLGFTGLSPADEREVVASLAATPGSTVIERRAMERPLSAADARFSADPPKGVERLPVSAVTVDALADLDRRAFRGAVEELLMGSEPDAHRRSLEAVLNGRLGRLLPEASASLVEPEPTRLVGAILTAERSPRHAIFHNLMVDPERRRRGLGRFLLGWALRALLALGYDDARLWVSLENTAAVTLYQSLGFRTTLEATIYRWDRSGSAAQRQASR
jgi:ribosomal protein S18 acetylase RimI-like enzyme